MKIKPRDCNSCPYFKNTREFAPFFCLSTVWEHIQSWHLGKDSIPHSTMHALKFWTCSPSTVRSICLLLCHLSIVLWHSSSNELIQARFLVYQDDPLNLKIHIYKDWFVFKQHNNKIPDQFLRAKYLKKNYESEVQMWDLFIPIWECVCLIYTVA